VFGLIRETTGSPEDLAEILRAIRELARCEPGPPVGSIGLRAVKQAIRDTGGDLDLAVGLIAARAARRTAVRQARRCKADLARARGREIDRPRDRNTSPLRQQQGHEPRSGSSRTRVGSRRNATRGDPDDDFDSDPKPPAPAPDARRQEALGSQNTKRSATAPPNPKGGRR
jgi:hypothetical protein